MTSLPFFSPPAAQKQRGVIFPLWKGGPHETSLSHIPLRLDTGLLLDGLLHFAFLFQRISAGPRILQHPDRPAAWLVRPFDRPAATLCGGQGGPPKGSLPGAVRRPADPGHAAVHRRSAPASWTGRPRGTLSLPVAPASAPDLPALCPGDGLCQPGYAAELRPCPGCGGRVLRAGLHPLRQRSRRFWSKVYPCAAWRPPFPSGPVPQPSRRPHPQRPRHRLPSPFGGATPGSSPYWPGWFFSTPATIFS